MSTQRNFTSNILTVHRRIMKDIVAQFARARRGRYAWSPSVHRHIRDNTPLFQKIEEAARVTVRDRKNYTTGD